MAIVSWKTQIFTWFTGQTRNILANCTGVEVVDISTTDFYFTRPCKAIQTTTPGVVKCIMQDDSIATVTTTSDNPWVDRGIFQGVVKTGTTAAGISGWLQ